MSSASPPQAPGGNKKLSKIPSLGGMKDDEPVIKEGMVLKCGRKFTSTWKRRYLVLRPTTLSYHAGESASVGERRYIEISQGSTVKANPQKHQFCFQVCTPGFRRITARAKSAEDLMLWIAAIEEVIARAPAHPIKVVVVGDELTSGKNVLVESYITLLDRRSGDGSRVQNPHGVIAMNPEKTRFIKSPDELLITDVMLEIDEDQFVKLGLWNTDGRERFQAVRLLAYPHTDLFVLVFSTDNIASFELLDTFVKEIKSKVSQPVMMLAGTTPIGATIKKVVEFDTAKQKAEALGCVGYVEARIESAESCEEVFSHAVRICVERKSGGDRTTPSAAGRSVGSSRSMAALAAALTSKAKKLGGGGGGSGAGGGTGPSPTNRSTALSTGSAGGGKGQVFFGSKDADTTPPPSTKGSSSVVSKTTTGDDDDDSDEGSVIGVEVDESEELVIDFGFTSDHVDDPSYLKKVAAKAEKAATVGMASLGGSAKLRSLAPLGEIAEQDTEEMEEQMEEMRRMAEKKEKELRAVRQTLDSLKNQNREVEEQLASMKKLMEEMQGTGGGGGGGNNNGSPQLPANEVTVPSLPGIPPLHPAAAAGVGNKGTSTNNGSPFLTRSEIRSRYAQAGRSASVFF